MLWLFLPDPAKECCRKKECCKKLGRPHNGPLTKTGRAVFVPEQYGRVLADAVAVCLRSQQRGLRTTTIVETVYTHCRKFG